MSVSPLRRSRHRWSRGSAPLLMATLLGACGVDQQASLDGGGTPAQDFAVRPGSMDFATRPPVDLAMAGPPPDMAKNVGPLVCSTGISWFLGDIGNATMHPGLDCISCHATKGKAPKYGAAGTVHKAIADKDDCFGVSGVTVTLTDANGKAHTMTTNLAGNFYTADVIATPYTARLTYQGRMSEMKSPQTETKCAVCHTPTGEAGAPGRIIAP